MEDACLKGSTYGMSVYEGAVYTQCMSVYKCMSTHSYTVYIRLPFVKPYIHFSVYSYT